MFAFVTYIASYFIIHIFLSFLIFLLTLGFLSYLLLLLLVHLLIFLFVFLLVEILLLLLLLLLIVFIWIRIALHKVENFFICCRKLFIYYGQFCISLLGFIPVSEFFIPFICLYFLLHSLLPQLLSLLLPDFS